MTRSDLAISVVSIASTSFTILFGVTAVFPAVLDYVEIEDTRRRVKLIKRMDYRFVKRLATGRSMWTILACAVLLLVADIGVLVSLWFDLRVLLSVSAAVTVLSIGTVVFTILVSLWQANGPNSDEIELIEQYVP